MSNSVVTLTASVGEAYSAGLGTTAAEISQIIELATGRAPTGTQLAGWGAYQETGASLTTITSAFVASTMFADAYNNGSPVDPDAPITAPIATAIIDYAVGSHTAGQVSAWVASGDLVAQVFQAFALGDQFTALEAPLNDGLTLLAASANGNLTGAITSGGTSTAGISIPSFHLGPGEPIYFGNAATETLANINGASEVNVSSVTSLAQAIDLAAATASASQAGGLIPADTGVFDWFQYGGNTYLVEAINPTSTPEAQTALTASDAVVEITGTIDMSGLELSEHTAFL